MTESRQFYKKFRYVVSKDKRRLGEIIDDMGLNRGTLYYLEKNPTSKPQPSTITQFVTEMLKVLTREEIEAVIPVEWNYRIPSGVIKNYYNQTILLTDEQAWFTHDRLTFLTALEIFGSSKTYEEICTINSISKGLVNRLLEEDIVEINREGKLSSKCKISYRDKATYDRINQFQLDGEQDGVLKSKGGGYFSAATTGQFTEQSLGRIRRVIEEEQKIANLNPGTNHTIVSWKVSEIYNISGSRNED